MSNDPTINFTAREWAMYKAGSGQGHGAALKAVSVQLKQALQSGKPFDELADSFKEWARDMESQAELRISTSNENVKRIGPAPSNLRTRVHNAIVGAIEGFKQ
jgi:hypothetical protein